VQRVQSEGRCLCSGDIVCESGEAMTVLAGHTGRCSHHTKAAEPPSLWWSWSGSRRSCTYRGRLRHRTAAEGHWRSVGRSTRTAEGGRSTVAAGKCRLGRTTGVSSRLLLHRSLSLFLSHRRRRCSAVHRTLHKISN